MDIRLIAALLLLPLACAIAGDDISGDYLEHFIVHPLTRHIPLRSDPVQSRHIALDGDKQVKVLWLTPHINFNNTFQPSCYYGVTSTHLDHQVMGEAFTYTAGMFQLTLNLATINLSKVTQKYDVPIFYICGDAKYGWSNETYFKIQPSYIVDPIFKNQHLFNKFERNEDSVISMHQNKIAERYESSHGSYQKTIALIGDMGVTHDENTAASIKGHIDSGHVQMIVHVGDISYADNFDETHHNNSYIWVEYMYNIQNLTARVPYMTAPGNHEAQFKFAAYLNWFKMPYLLSSSMSPFWYSFDYMGVHFTAYSSEHNFSKGSEQNEWIAADLEKAHGNRANVPWLFIFGHRPLYCTADDDSRCIHDAAEFRLNIEDLLYKYKVDVHMSGHNHQYERSYPVYQEQATQFEYINPRATTYIVNGAAGSPEPLSAKFKKNIEWRAFMYPHRHTGYMLMTPTKLTLHFEYVDSTRNATVDQFTIVRTRR